jgi:hypothetical protein
MTPLVHARLMVAVLVALALPAAVRAQAADAPAAPAAPGAAACPAPLLVSSPVHWLPGAVRRVDLAGSHELGTTGTGSLPLGVAIRALEAAAAHGETAAVRAAASLYLERLAVEYPRLAAAGDAGCGRWLDGRATAGYVARRGVFTPGWGYEPEAWTGAMPVAPVSSPAAGLAAAGGWGRFGGSLDVVAHGGGVDVADAHVAMELGDVVVWAGRQTIHYGPGRGGGVVLGGDAWTTALGVVVTDPIRLPWVLGLLGPIGMESFVSRARGGPPEGQPEGGWRFVDPWLWGARLTASPHRRFRIGASRGTMYGGEGNTEVTPRYALQMLMGMHSGLIGEFDNHFGAVDLRFLPPGVPLELYLEWGMNDSAGAWWAIPGRLVGVSWPALPFAPGVGVGAEFVHFPRSCCGNPIWYRNWSFRMGWTNDGEALAHPLGGHGQELSLRADAVLPGGAAVGHVRAFHRLRREENLFSPEWEGPSLGAEALLHYQPGPGAGALLRGYLESGDGWRAARLFGGVTWSFGG